MPITVVETIDSRRMVAGSDPSFQLKYAIIGTNNEVEGRAALMAVAPVNYDIYGNGTIVLPRETVEIENAGHLYQTAIVLYHVSNGGFGAGPSIFPVAEFDTTQMTAHITEAISTQKYPSGPVANFQTPDFGNAIAVDGEGNVQGVEIPVPSMEWTESWRFQFSVVTGAYLDLIENMRGTVNNNIFRGKESGSVMFLGAAGRSNFSEQMWDISFRFLHIPNALNLSIGGIQVASKKGHEFLWSLYEQKDDPNAAYLTRKIRGVYVNKIFEEVGFSALGIGS